MSVGRIILLESPNALDLLEDTGETTSLSQVCKLFGHDIASFLIRDKKELAQTLMYISSLGWHDDQRRHAPIFLHISTHGNSTGLAIGPDDLTWRKLATIVVKAFRKIYSNRKPYKGPISLVVSACGTDGTALSKRLAIASAKHALDRPPEYIFVFDDAEITWQDAVVAWTIFYSKVPDINFGDESQKDDVKDLLGRVKRSGYGKLRYFRWDRKKRKYLTYPKSK